MKLPYDRELNRFRNYCNLKLEKGHNIVFYVDVNNWQISFIAALR